MRAARIPLRGREGRARAYALVDEADYADLSQFRWFLNSGGYARRTQYLGGGRKRDVTMHRFILDAPQSLDVDHINRDRLDNRRTNLRLVPEAGTAQNRGSHGGGSRHRGVCWDRDRNKWRARAQFAGRRVHLGLYVSEKEAAAVASSWRALHMPYAVETVS